MTDLSSWPGWGRRLLESFRTGTCVRWPSRPGRNACRDAGLAPGQIESFYLGNFAGPAFVGQNHLAPYVSTALGIQGVPSTRIEAACASGGSAFFHAWSEVAAGIYDVVMVVGVEKMTSQPTPRVSEILAEAGDCGGEMRAGNTFASLFAMIARRHMYQFGTTREHLAAVAVKNHANGAQNPDAHMRKVITLEQALNGKPVADPLTVYDCSLISDGAAAVMLVPLERAAEFTEQAGSRAGRRAGFRRAWRSTESRTSPCFPAVRAAAEKAYRMAGVEAKISSSPNCTIASPSPRSWPSRTWASCARRGRAVRVRGARRCTASGR